MTNAAGVPMPRDGNCPRGESAAAVSRRAFLAGAGVAATLAVACRGGRPAEAAEPQGKTKEDWSKIRGFNYQPSYGRNGIEIWMDRFDAACIDRELALGRQYFPTMNAVRLWLSFDGFLKNPQQCSENFQLVLALCEKYQVRALPVLFNNWHSLPDFGGISSEMIGYWFADHGQKGESPNYVFRPYLEALFQAHATDRRILAWDLCNEPFNSGQDVYLEWLRHTYQLGKRLGAVQPIGVSVGAALEQVQLVEPFSDVLMIHPYFAAKRAWEPLHDFAQQHGKPLLATECCWGALDDAARVNIIRSDLGTLRQQGIGFFAHALHESYVADLHRPQYGVLSGAEYMAFIHMDGSLRAGHAAFNEFP